MVIFSFFWKIISLPRIKFVILKHCEIVSHANKMCDVYNIGIVMCEATT